MSSLKRGLIGCVVGVFVVLFFFVSVFVIV